jgi:hypothetical protein
VPLTGGGHVSAGDVLEKRLQRCRATDDEHVRLRSAKSSVRRACHVFPDEVLPMSVWRCSLRTVNMNFCWVSKMRFSSAVPGM